MGVQAGRMRTKRMKEQVKEQQKATSRGRKRKVNLLKKVIKDEMNEEEKKYFGKEGKGMEVEEDNNNSERIEGDIESEGE